MLADNEVFLMKAIICITMLNFQGALAWRSCASTTASAPHVVQQRGYSKHQQLHLHITDLLERHSLAELCQRLSIRTSVGNEVKPHISTPLSVFLDGFV